MYRLSSVDMTKNALKWVIFCQYVFRFWRIYPLYQEMKKTSGTFFENARAGAALNLLLYMLASHVSSSYKHMHILLTDHHILTFFLAGSCI